MQFQQDMQTGDSLQTIGKYRIIGAIGRGSMGVVYKGQDPEIGRTVAIKTLRRITNTHFHDADAALERFKLEARSAGNLRHPNIITIFDVNVEGDMPYIVMDFVEGTSLDSILAKQGKLDITEVLAYLEQISGGLAAAHEKGVIHRDIKPSNLLIDNNGRVYILDFGVAKINESFSDSEKDSSAEPVMGTPGYMSPEQIMNQPLDARSDLFSLAIVAFECLTGQRPFPGSNFTEVVSNILNSKPLSMSSLAPELPLALEVEFERALSRNRDNRFESASEMVTQFKKVLGLDPTKAVTPNQRGINQTRKRKPSEWKSLSEDSGAYQRDSGLSKMPNVPLGGGQNEGKELIPAGQDLVNYSRASGIADRDWGHDDFAKIFEESETNFGSSVGFQPSRVSPLKIFTTIFSVICLFLGGFLYLQISENNLPVVGNNTNVVKPPDRNVREGPDIPLDLPPLTVNDREDCPQGATISEMSDKQVIGCLTSQNVSEKMILRGLREVKTRSIPKFVEASVIVLEHDSYVVRVETVKLLAQLGDKRIVPTLVSKLDDYDPEVRRQTAIALGTLGSRTATPYLSDRYLREPVAAVKGEIKSAIETINGYPMRSQL